MKELDFSFITNKPLKKQVEQAFKELLKLKIEDCPTMVAFNCAHIIELLLYHQLKESGNIEETDTKPSLGKLIDEAVKFKIINPLVKAQYHQVKVYRNLFHATQIVESGLKIQPEEAEICRSVLKILFRDLYPDNYKPILGELASWENPAFFTLGERSFRETKLKLPETEMPPIFESPSPRVSVDDSEEYQEYLKEIQSADSMLLYHDSTESPDYELSLDDYNRAIAICPDRPEAFLRRSKVYEKLGDFTKAKKDLNRAIALYPKGKAGINDLEYECEILAGANLSLGLFGEVSESEKEEVILNRIASFSKAIEINPNRPEAFLKRAKAYEDLEDYEKALQDINQAIANFNQAKEFDLWTITWHVRCPPLSEIFLRRASLNHYYLENYDMAIDDYTKAISLVKNYKSNWRMAEFLYGRAQCYLEKEDFDSAIKDLSECLECLESPESKFAFIDKFGAYLLRGVAYYRLEEYEKAISDWKEALSIKPEEFVPYGNLAKVLDTTGNFREALDFYKTYLLKVEEKISRNELEKDSEMEEEIAEVKERIAKLEAEGW